MTDPTHIGAAAAALALTQAALRAKEAGDV